MTPINHKCFMEIGLHVFEKSGTQTDRHTHTDAATLYNIDGGGDSCCKWKDFQLSRARDLELDLGSGHTAYRRASIIDLYLQRIRGFAFMRYINPRLTLIDTCHMSLKSKQLFVGGQTDGRTFETNFIRSNPKRRPKNRVALKKRSGQKSVKAVQEEEVKTIRGRDFENRSISRSPFSSVKWRQVETTYIRL